MDRKNDTAKKKIKLSGQELYVAKCDDFVPEDRQKLGWIHFSKSNEEKMLMIELIAVFVFDFVLFCTDAIMAGNLGLWIAIHAAGSLCVGWLIENSVEVRE